MTGNPNATLDLCLIHRVLLECEIALPVLRTMCKHAGLRIGAETAEQMLVQVKKAIAESERFSKEVRGE